MKNNSSIRDRIPEIFTLRRKEKTEMRSGESFFIGNIAREIIDKEMLRKRKFQTAPARL